MWQLFDDSTQEPQDEDEASELWGLFDASEDVSWQHKALCAQTDPEAFFPEKGGSTREAKMICSRCEVHEQCLKWAIERDERFGIWGGMSERERRKYKKDQA
jgi:WhiB family redox-sensing transcriptional regulator